MDKRKALPGLHTRERESDEGRGGVREREREGEARGRGKSSEEVYFGEVVIGGKERKGRRLVTT